VIEHEKRAAFSGVKSSRSFDLDCTFEVNSVGNELEMTWWERPNFDTNITQKKKIIALLYQYHKPHFFFKKVT